MHKNANNVIFAVIILTGITLTSCFSGTQQPTITGNIKGTVSAAASATGRVTTQTTAIETQFPTPTPDVFLTDTPTACPTFEFDTELSLTPSENVSLTPTEQVIDKNAFFDMLSNNGGCTLPCVLGVTPGIVYAKENDTKWIQTAEFEGNEEVSFKTEVFDNFVIFTSRLYGSESVSVISLSYEICEVGDDFRLNNIRLSTFQHDTTEENFGQAIYGTNEYGRLMEGYSSNTILKQYGKPTQIVLRIEHYESLHIEQPAFDIVFLGYYYGQHQFYVAYEFIVDDTTKGFDICPSNGFISLWAWPLQEEGGYSFFTNSYIDTSLDLDSYKEINSYDGVTIEKFYEVMSGEDITACFSIQAIK